MNQKSMQVLLVEDNIADAALVRQAFSHGSSGEWLFYGVETLDEAILAYRHMQDDREKSPFDLVLLDLGLPDVQGLETVQQFLAASPEAPVVVLSGMDDQLLALKAIEQGAQDYLVKDQITLQTLLKSVRFAMQRQYTLKSLRQSFHLTQQALYQSQEVNIQQLSFIGMVSHELRNPLGIIQMSTELMQMNLEVVLNAPKMQKWLSKIQQANDQVQYLLNDVLTLCRLQAESLSCKFSCVRLSRFCTDLVDEIQQTSDENYTIELTVQKGLSHTFTDVQLLKVILTNLISNAIKYTPQGGIIRFTVTATPNWITFLVEDSGIGISQEDQQQLFEYFYRASNATHITGTGLGLAIVKRCVNALQGTIEVESQINRGSTFKVQLPLILSIDNVSTSFSENQIEQPSITS